jgi:hypothetical protein
MRITCRVLCAVVLRLAGSGVCAYADPVLSLTPTSGVVGAQPGQTTGWGFTITNDTSDYLLVDASYFRGTGGDPQFTDCTDPSDPPISYGPAIGVYTDFIANNVTLVSPDSSLTEAFSLTLQQGVGSYAITSGTPALSADIGNLFVIYDEYDGNPFDPVDPGTEVQGIPNCPPPHRWMRFPNRPPGRLPCCPCCCSSGWPGGNDPRRDCG